jgi:NAD(P)-dependent dehydrogenase (short-subunit alcohol dehydrogenase family)
MRLKDKVAIVVGAGQSPGEGLGNGRATVLRFAQEGAKVLAVDNNLSSAEQTVAMARQSGGECVAFEADVADETTLAAMVEAAGRRWGRVDVLDYNVGVGIAAGDAPLYAITEAAFDRIATINLRGAIMACKHVLPLMRA